MGKVIPEITSKEEAFIASQKIFFVATAALSKDHHVSVSPKANDATFVVLNPTKVAYADYTGSGAETAAHVLQNQRMTIMFCNIEQGLPNILRLFGTGEVVLAENVSKSILNKFPKHVINDYGFRAIYILNIHRISTSCGYSLPIMEFHKFRTTLRDVTEKGGAIGAYNYMTLHNSFSIDGLPSLALLRKDAPPNVVPIYEDGYVHGKVLDTYDASNEVNRPTSKKQQLRLQQYHHHHRYSSSILYKQFHLGIQHLVLGAIIFFVAGILLGKHFD